jgi:hypothetical protein
VQAKESNERAPHGAAARCLQEDQRSRRSQFVAIFRTAPSLPAHFAPIPKFPNTIVFGAEAEYAGHSASPFASGFPVRMKATK